MLLSSISRLKKNWSRIFKVVVSSVSLLCGSADFAEFFSSSADLRFISADFSFSCSKINLLTCRESHFLANRVPLILKIFEIASMALNLSRSA